MGKVVVVENVTLDGVMQTDGNPYTEVLNRKPRFLASRTLSEPLPWQNSSLLSTATPRWSWSRRCQPAPA